MKRRKVGNMLALAVLSALLERPMHPYEMASVLKGRGKDADMKIKWGTLYSVVANLGKHGFIEVVESVQEGGRPERTVYRLTPSGRAEFEDWVRELVGTVEHEPVPFQAGLSMMTVLGPDQAIELLRDRLAQLELRIDAQREGLEAWRRKVPRMFLVENEYDLAIAQAEAGWLRGLIEDFASGAIRGIDEWRHWHETGELPADLGELVEEEK